MFSLIITIVSIALVVALIAATLYHGDSALEQGKSTVNAASLVGVAQEISVALNVQKALHNTQIPPNTVVSADFLTPESLRTLPTGWTINCAEVLCQIRHSIPLDQEEVCLSVNEQALIGRKLTLTAYEIATAPYHCVPLESMGGGITAYRFNYMHRR